jgi:signal transduction histidine kinase
LFCILLSAGDRALKALDLKLAQKGLILVVLPLAFELASFGLLYQALSNADQELKLEMRNREIQERLNKIGRLVLYSTYSVYVHDATQSEDSFSSYRYARDQVMEQLSRLQQLFENPSSQQSQLDKLRDLIDRLVMNLDESRRLGDLGKLQSAFREIEQVKVLYKQITVVLDGLVQPLQKSVDTGVKRSIEARQQLKNALLFAIGASIVLALALYSYFHRDTMKRLSIMMSNAKKFAAGKDLLPKLSGNDELAELDNVFHDMAGTIKEEARRKQEFMSMISHDLRGPLTSVSIALERMSDMEPERVDETFATMTRRCNNNVQRLVQLTHDLLDLDKLESGKLELQVDSVPVAYIAEMAMESVRDIAEQKGITLHSPDTELEMQADADRLVQVLVNLLGNALKFSPPKSTIEISAEEVENCIEISGVTDQGPGIPENEQAKVFDRFEQTSSAKTIKVKGTGLGLAICKELVQLHNGRIGVRTGANGGACFWFRIPVPAMPAQSL